MAIQDNVVSISFSDNRIPEFKETPGEDYIKYGDNDQYPDDLLTLFNKSAKHNAIINGKVNYILGGGLEVDNQDAKALEFLNEVKKIDGQTLTDVELFGGFAWEIIPKFGGGYNIHHIGFKNIRSNKDGSTFFFKNDWKDRAEERKPYPAFHRDLQIPSIFYWKEYRPGCKVYPLPGYVAAINYIESDIEVSKHTLTNAQSGFSASKMVNFYNGEPDETAKRDITRRFEMTATGAEGKKLLLSFNNPQVKAPEVLDLGASDLTKEDFSHVNNMIAGEIFTGHLITHPLLFGVQQEGKLGGATELREAFEIFKNTYVNGKQKQFEEIVNFFASVKGIVAKYKLKDVEPIGIQFSETTMLEVAPRSWILEKMGIDPVLYPDAPASGVLPAGPETLGAEGVNDNLKNLTGKQAQHLNRTIRQFNNGTLTRAAAAVLLKSSFAFTEEEINQLLGKDATQKFSSDEITVAAFEAHGETRETYETIRTKAATFNEDDEALELSLAFDDDYLNAPEVAEAKRPPIKTGMRPPIAKSFPKFMIRYSYEVRDGEGPEILPTSREFCVRMVSMNKFYSRTDIQKISALLGYNVFERVGGYWNDGGVIKKHCRHEWKANIVVKK